MTEINSVLDYPPERLQQYLVRTGQTLEELKVNIEASSAAARILVDNDDAPVMSSKFSDPTGFDVEP